MWNFIITLAQALRPPLNDDPISQLRWRWTVVVVLIGIMGSGIIGAAWIRGDLPGLSGVALADNLTTLDTKITIRQNNLEQKLLTVQKKEDKKIDAVTVLIIQANLHQVLKNRCVAISAHNQLALESANQSIEEYDDQFRNIKGYSFPEIVYPCSVLLIGPDGH